MDEPPNHFPPNHLHGYRYHHNHDQHCLHIVKQTNKNRTIVRNQVSAALTPKPSYYKNIISLNRVNQPKKLTKQEQHSPLRSSVTKNPSSLFQYTSTKTSTTLILITVLVSTQCFQAQASPTTTIITTDSNNNSRSRGSAEYNTGDHSADAGVLSSSVTSDDVRKSAEMARLSKMAESDAPHLQSIMRDLWHWRTQDSPEFATMAGLNDNTAGRLDAFTDEHFAARKEQCEAFLVRASQLKQSALNFEDQMNLKILKYYLNSYVENFEYIKWYSPLSVLEGPHLSFPRLVQEQMLLRSYDDFQKLLSRYGGFPRQMQEVISLLQHNIDTGVVPPLLALDGLLERVSRFAVSVTESSFFKPFVDLPAAITTLQRRSLRQQAQERVAQDVLPAYKSLHQFLQVSYTEAARSSAGIGSLEGGPDVYKAALRYHTATSLTPSQIHALGLKELKRIQPLLRQAVEAAGLRTTSTTTPTTAAAENNKNSSSTSLEQLMAALRDEPGRYFETTEQLIEAFEVALARVIDDGDAADDAHHAIDLVPKTELRIRGSSLESLSSRVVYEPASLDGTRHAVITVDTSDIKLISRDEVTALSLSTGAPGQHLLSEYLRTSTGVPTYRRMLGDVRISDAPAKFPVYSSFVRGWALYAQFLGEHLGMYDDDRQRLGRYTIEAVEAAVMVVDTGIHHLGWTVDAASTFMLHNTPLSPVAIKNEVRRVVTWPGLASSAKVGEIKLKELRQKALNALGELFKLREFHTVVLKCTGPINLLQLCVDHYIDSVTDADALARSRSEELQREEEQNRRKAELDALSPEKVPPDYTSGSSCRYKPLGICFIISSNISFNYFLALLVSVVIVRNVAVIV